MKTLIEQFPDQLKEAVAISNASNLKPNGKIIANVLITGLGGSGIGGKIVADFLKPIAKVPIGTNNDYHIPAYVGPNTLVIVSSYSGNTEETLQAMNEALAAGAEVACITSGGTVESISKEKGLNHIVVPGGNPPRACLGYSLVQQFKLLQHYGIHDLDFVNEIQAATNLIIEDADFIKTEARAQAERFKGKTPVIYSSPAYEGVIVRLRQQLNENSKTLCWHHIIPEMNHNELVGWGGGRSEYEVLLFRTDDDYNRTSVRMDISSEVISKKTQMHTFHAKGESQIQRMIYLINYGDWISWYLSEINGVDAIEIDVINHLKSELSKI